jgi:hypothetical protein
MSRALPHKKLQLQCLRPEGEQLELILEGTSVVARAA